MLITVLFFRTSAAANLKFESFLPERDGQKQVTKAMVAFAAAAVRAGSLEFGVDGLTKLHSAICLLQSDI